jgi:hypothetical protein
MVVVRVDLRHISDEKKLSYSDVLWQYVKQDFLWRINNAGLGKVLWLQKPYFATGEKLAFYYVYGSPGGRAEDNGTPFDVISPKLFACMLCCSICALVCRLKHNSI